VLTTLWFTGELMVSSRRNFQRLYDLRERVLPNDVDTNEPEPEDAARFFMRRAVVNRGVARADRARWGIWPPARIGPAVAELVESGEVVPIEVEGLDDEPLIAFADDLHSALTDEATPTGLHILSPFDNMTIDRGFLATFFGFDYKIECYVPAAKRKWGYFCLPILWGDRFIARLDAKADRKAKALLLRRLMFENGFDDYDRLWPALSEKLREFAKFNGCESIVVEDVAPAKLKTAARRALSFP
jgi:uncharacterized protein YcaQ